MTKRHITIDVVDEGDHVQLLVSFFEHIGGTCVGPQTVVDEAILSFPEADNGQWVRDMLVCLIERA